MPGAGYDVGVERNRHSSGTRYTSPFLSAADAQNISALLGGTAWNGATITYSFPTSPASTAPAIPTVRPSTDSASSTPPAIPDSARKPSAHSAWSRATRSSASTRSPRRRHPRNHPAREHEPVRGPDRGGLPAEQRGAGGDIWFGGTGDSPVMGNYDSGQAVLQRSVTRSASSMARTRALTAR